jgi:hypothetical protein
LYVGKRPTSKGFGGLYVGLWSVSPSTSGPNDGRNRRNLPAAQNLSQARSFCAGFDVDWAAGQDYLAEIT